MLLGIGQLVRVRGKAAAAQKSAHGIVICEEPRFDFSHCYPQQQAIGNRTCPHPITQQQHRARNAIQVRDQDYRLILSKLPPAIHLAA